MAHGSLKSRDAFQEAQKCQKYLKEKPTKSWTRKCTYLLEGTWIYLLIIFSFALESVRIFGKEFFNTYFPTLRLRNIGNWCKYIVYSGKLGCVPFLADSLTPGRSLAKSQRKLRRLYDIRYMGQIFPIFRSYPVPDENGHSNNDGRSKQPYGKSVVVSRNGEKENSGVLHHGSPTRREVCYR